MRDKHTERDTAEAVREEAETGEMQSRAEEGNKPPDAGREGRAFFRTPEPTLPTFLLLFFVLSFGGFVTLARGS